MSLQDKGPVRHSSGAAAMGLAPRGLRKCARQTLPSGLEAVGGDGASAKINYKGSYHRYSLVLFLCQSSWGAAWSPGISQSRAGVSIRVSGHRPPRTLLHM